MSQKPIQKQSFLHGAAILALGTLIVKLIGMVYKMPLVQIIGNDGYGYFNNAYDIYNVLLTISTAGLPVAMSRMISEAQTLGNNAQIKRIYRVSLYVFLTVGLLGSGCMLLFAKQFAIWLNSPNSWIAMACLAPSVFFVCLVSSFRGYFQGQRNMTPTAVSQILEAVFRLIIGLGLAVILVRAGYSVAVGAGGAIIGVTAGTAVTAEYMWRKH
ncbi:MAG: oligosaccharide flippase family protein, partial [Oscillospiraceae bacterium]|nr:oligosaccharide flippase family protein [Oscillospiraceae bacterium]